MSSMYCSEFEEFCEPICNFRAARFKFTKVSQRQGEAINTIYNRILKLARHSVNHSDINERLIDAIIFGTICVKAQDKLFQTPRTLKFATVFNCMLSLQEPATSYSANTTWI